MTSSGAFFVQDKPIWKEEFLKDFKRILNNDDALLKAINYRQSIMIDNNFSVFDTSENLEKVLKQFDLNDPKNYSYDAVRIKASLLEVGYTVEEIEGMKPSDKIKIEATIFYALSSCLAHHPETHIEGVAFQKYQEYLIAGNQEAQDDKTAFTIELTKATKPFIEKYLKRHTIKLLNPDGKKIGGAQNAGDLTGIYSITVKDEKEQQYETKALVKQEVQKEKNLIEYAVSRLARAFSGDDAYLFAEIFLVPVRTIPNATREQRKEKSPYVASVFVADPGQAKDLWKYVYERYLSDDFKHIRKRNGHLSLSMPASRPRNLGTGEPKVVFDSVLPVLFEGKSTLKTEFAHIIAMNYWHGNPDTHMGNIMVCLSPEGKIKGFRSIDFAGGFDWFGWEETLLPLRAESPVRGFQPTNHIKEYSRNFRITPEMAAAFEKYATITDKEIADEAEALASELVNKYEMDARVLEEKLTSQKVTSASIANISREIVIKLKSKRDEFQKLALEIRLSCYFTPKDLYKPEVGFICEGPNLIEAKKALIAYERVTHSNIEYEKLTFRSRGQEYHTDELRALVKKISETDESKLEEIISKPHDNYPFQTSSYSMPLAPRLKYAFLDIYDLNTNSSFQGRCKKFIGWPNEEWNVFLKIFIFIFKMPHTILKFGIEFLPAIGEQFFNSRSDSFMKVLENSETSDLEKQSAGVFFFLTKSISYIFLAIRLVGMCITSPKKTIEQFTELSGVADRPFHGNKKQPVVAESTRRILETPNMMPDSASAPKKNKIEAVCAIGSYLTQHTPAPLIPGLTKLKF